MVYQHLVKRDGRRRGEKGETEGKTHRKLDKVFTNFYKDGDRQSQTFSWPKGPCRRNLRSEGHIPGGFLLAPLSIDLRKKGGGGEHIFLGGGSAFGRLTGEKESQSKQNPITAQLERKESRGLTAGEEGEEGS